MYNMKNLILPFVVGIAMICTSCSNIFDLDNLKKVEAEGEWGIPLFNDRITMGYLLQKLDSVTYLRVGDNGTITFVFESNAIQLAQASDIVHPVSKVVDSAGTLPSISLPVAGYAHLNLNDVVHFNLNTDSYTAHLASVESGYISVFFSLSNYSGAYTVTLTSPQITKADGTKLKFTLNQNTTSASIDLSGCTIRPNDNEFVLFDADITLQHPGGVLSGINYYALANIQDFKYNQIIGRFAPYTAEFNTAVSTELPFDKMTLTNIRFFNPSFNIATQNSFTNGICNLNSITLEQSNGSTNPLINGPTSFIVPYSGSDYFSQSLESVPSFIFDSQTDSIRMAGNMVINPEGAAAGDIRIDKNSKFTTKMKIEVPGNICIDEAVYNDTVNNALYNTVPPSMASSVNSIQLRVAAVNNCPIEFTPELIFIDTLLHESTVVNLKSLYIHGSYDEHPYVITPAYIEITGVKARKIIAAQKMVIRLKVSSNNHNIHLSTYHYLETTIGAKVQYSELNF